MRNWILGSTMAVMSIGGLLVASHAAYGIAYYGGLLYFIFAVVFIMVLIKTSYDESGEVTALGEFKKLFVKMMAFARPTPTVSNHDKIVIRSIDVADLRDALAKGVADFKAMPTHLVYLLAIYPLVMLILGRISAGYDVLPLVFPLLSGYTLIGPLVATGMYELSRRHEQGLNCSRRHAFTILLSTHLRPIAGLGLGLLLIYFSWLGTAIVIYREIFGHAVPTSIVGFASQVFATPAGWTLMIIGSSVGFVFAAIVFTLSVISFPMLLHRDVSIMTAVQTSIRAVLANPKTMAIWGFTIACTLLLGSLPVFVGLAFILPILGHSSWHLYRKVVAD